MPRFNFIETLKVASTKEYIIPETLTMEILQPMLDSISNDDDIDKLQELMNICTRYETKSPEDAKVLLKAVQFVRSVTE